MLNKAPQSSHALLRVDVDGERVGTDTKRAQENNDDSDNLRAIDEHLQSL